MTSPPVFYSNELERALKENAFAIKQSEILPNESGSDHATAKLTLLEGRVITVELYNGGFRIQGHTQIYDTLDSLLLNNSPKSMEMVSQVLSSKLEQLIARDDPDDGADEATTADLSESRVAPETTSEGVAADEGKDKAEPTTQATLTSSPHDPLSSELQPVTNATLTIRCIKSFEYRTEKNLVLKGLDLTTLTAGELIEKCREAVRSTPGWKPYKMVKFDTLKLYNQAHSHKTMNLIINLENDDWILDDMKRTMADCGAVNETEYSLFNREAYNTFKANPTIRWD